ncbi:MAG: hypothetical protein HY046_04020 [Acidobacteria bacterium]|nr:hypothetical protein [Acidobacteriota bacterium]
MSQRLAKVLGECQRYDHPLFAFDARSANGDDVELLIRFKHATPELYVYSCILRARELDHPQFEWMFQKQLYDCLHDYVIEMFTDNPQREK